MSPDVRAVTAPRERGAVTAELAVGLVGVVLVLAALLGVGVVAQAQLRCVDAARAGARAAARGEPAGQVNALVLRLAGPGAQVATARDGDLVRVRVSTTVALPLPGAPGVGVEGAAAAAVEVTG